MPVHFDQVCFVAPKSTTKPQWKSVFLAFDTTIWISLLITYWITLLAWYEIKTINEKHFDGTLLAINLYAILLMVPVNKAARKCSERIMMLIIILFGFVVASSFQGSMVRFLAYETYEPDITTIEELAESELSIMSASLNLKELIETDENPIMSRLLSKFSWDETKDILGEIAYQRNGASIGRKSDLEEKIATSYIQNNQAQLHIVEECPRSYHIAYLVPKKSPYLAIFNDIINYFVEAGITSSWFIHSKPFRPLSDYHQSAKQAHVVFTVENVIIAFIILIVGLTLSCFVFIIEVLIFAYNEKNVTNTSFCFQLWSSNSI